MKKTTYVTRRVTITIDVGISGAPAFDDATLSAAITRGMRDYRDGRFYFSVELVQAGVEQLVRDAIKGVLRENAKAAKYPGQIADRAIQTVEIHAGSSDAHSATITTVEE